MPDFNVTSPDGKKFKVTAPDGATHDQVLDYAKSQFAKTQSSSLDNSSPSLFEEEAGKSPDAITRGALKFGVGTSQLLNEIGVGKYIPTYHSGEGFKLGLQSNDKLAEVAKTLDEKSKGKGVGGFVGEMVGNPITAMTSGVPGGPLVAGALSGAAQGITAPSEKKDQSLGDRGLSTLEDAAAGAVGGKLTQTVGKAIAPKFGDAVNLLKKSGVIMTPGQMAKDSANLVKGAEDHLTSVPALGGLIKEGHKRSIESFNTAILNRALEPVGEKMPKGIEPGRASIGKAEEIIGKKYDNLIPKLSFKLDKTFADEATQFNQNVVSLLPEGQQKQFADVMNTVISRRLNNGSLSGKDFKSVESELGYLAKDYIHSPNPADRGFGHALQEMQGMMRDNLARMNPKHAKELTNINTAWAMFKRAQGASVRRIKSQGVFSPTDLAQDIKKSSGKGSFARGDAMMQDLAEAGMHVLPSEIPDSGTVGRGLWAAMLAGGGHFISPPAAAGLGAASTLYTKPGMAALKSWANTGTSRDVVRKGIERAIPLMGSGAASGLNNFLNSGQSNTEKNDSVKEPVKQAPDPEKHSEAPTMQPTLASYKPGHDGPSFDHAHSILEKNEGGYVAKDGSTGHPAIYGINQKWYPNEFRIAKELTDKVGEWAGRKYAKEFYRDEFWNKNHLDKVKPESRAIVLDGVVNHRHDFAKKLTEAAKKGASPHDLMAMRLKEYKRLAKEDPKKYGGTLKTWEERLARIPVPKKVAKKHKVGYEQDPASLDTFLSSNTSI